MTILDFDALEAARARQRDADPALPALLLAAQDALDVTPLSVTDKPADRLAPSGDPHDYVSLGPYWWPNPDTPDGLPWVRHDGETNPAFHDTDHARLHTMQRAVVRLALAWFYAGERRYADHAAAMLRRWFLDPATRMNPHLAYGQSIPGRCEGRGIGLIDTRGLAVMLDTVRLLAGSPAWTPGDHDALRAWFADFLHWMRDSEHGRDEARQHNNHGTWYDVQIAAFALFTDQPDVARAQLQAVPERRIAAHIEPDGRQPHELARTRSLSYSVMNLVGHGYLARLGEAVGIELWHWSARDGRSIRSAVDFLLPHLADAAPWAWPQITPIEPTGAAELLRLAASRYPEPRYREAVRRLDAAAPPPAEVAALFPLP
ncbi:MAG: alginate lyase family protein [Phycisphaeraceae bacterium]